MTEPRTERPKDDPWKGIETIQIAPMGAVYLADEVDAARAETKRRHAEEIETLKAEHAEFRDSVASALVVENPDGPVSDEAIVMAAYESTMQLLDPPFSPSTQLAGMATERDTLRAQLAEASAVCACGCADADHESYGDDGQSCGQDGHDCYRVSPAALAELMKLRAQLAAVQEKAPTEVVSPQPDECVFRVRTVTDGNVPVTQWVSGCGSTWTPVTNVFDPSARPTCPSCNRPSRVESAPVSPVEPTPTCVWTSVPLSHRAASCCDRALPAGIADDFRWCPYCGKPLTLKEPKA